MPALVLFSYIQAFTDGNKCTARIVSNGILIANHEPIRIDEYTGKRFVSFQDPDGLLIELYEVILTENTFPPMEKP